MEKGRYYLRWAIELWGRKVRMRMEREQWRNSWKKCISNSGSVFSFSWVTIWTRHLIQFNVVSLWFLFLYPSFFNSWHIMLMYISWTKERRQKFLALNVEWKGVMKRNESQKWNVKTSKSDFSLSLNQTFLEFCRQTAPWTGSYSKTTRQLMVLVKTCD